MVLINVSRRGSPSALALSNSVLHVLCTIQVAKSQRSNAVRWPCRLRMSCWVIKMLVNCPSRGSTSGAADGGVRDAASAAAGDCGPHGVGAFMKLVVRHRSYAISSPHSWTSLLDATPESIHCLCWASSYCRCKPTPQPLHRQRLRRRSPQRCDTAMLSVG